VIVVIGSTYLRGKGSTAVPDGVAGRIALAAAADEATVELIAKIGDDPAGDALLVALARAGVGHVAVLRDAVHRTAQRRTDDDLPIEAALDPDVDADDEQVAWIADPAEAPALDPADVGLALRYLTEYRVVVAVHAPAGILTEATAAADWAGAHLVLVTDPGDPVPGDVPAGALVLEAVDGPEDGSALGARLGQYAAAVDRGIAPATAYVALTAEAG
jgi:hypothetical protein